jgi:hypothetical protein
MKSGAGQLSKTVLQEFGRNAFLLEHFTAVVDTIGDLPKPRQRILARLLNNARNIYRTRKMTEGQNYPLPSGELRELKAIRNTAIKLLKWMGVNNPSSIATNPFQNGMGVSPVISSRLLPVLQRVAGERRPNTETASALQRLSSLLLVLSDLVEAADVCAKDTRARPRSGRGGVSREGHTAEANLLNSLFDAFKAIQPKGSRAKNIKLDTVLKNFVKAGLAMVVANAKTTGLTGRVYLNFSANYVDQKLPTRITESAIRNAFSRWQSSQTKAKSRLV